MVGLIFHFSIRLYITHNAASELNEARELYNHTGLFTAVVRSGLFGRYINHFYFSDEFEMHYGHTGFVTDVLTETLREERIPPAEIINRRINTGNGTFFLTSQPAPALGEGWFAIFYVDTTYISRFYSQVIMLLFFAMVIVWAVAMIATTLLSGSLAHPLNVLNNFARQIGRGDFTQNTEFFANEEFETLNQNLNHTAKQLAKYDNDQKTFFQNVSHELRTPLMSIKSYAEGIKYGIMDAGNASETILEATNRLTGMVDDILYVSRIDNLTNPQKDEIDLRSLIAERVRLHEDPMKKVKIECRQDNEPVIVSCIQSYIERALDNLVSNALRYAETTITIECYNIGPKAVVRVLDDGPGFETDALDHVFERFYRGRNGLTGIGLAIVKSIIDQHDGTTLAENKEKGAVLTITLQRVR